MRLRLLAVALLLPALSFAGEPVRFAFITDNHYAAASASIGDLQACIDDINSSDSLDFVVMGGDLTDFGSDEEIAQVKSLLDQLRLRYWVIAGNHDSTWSESGCNTFKQVFGYEQFAFECKGWRFVGFNCGPDMRMMPALVPQETMVWLRGLDAGTPTIAFNHYPQDTSVLNYFDVTKELKRIGTRMMIGGHWHRNTVLNYDGLPAVLGRSALSAGGVPGYNIVEISPEGRVSVSERRLFGGGEAGGGTSVQLAPWYRRTLCEVRDTVSYDADGLPSGYPWLRYEVNDRYPQVRELWRVREEANIACGFAVATVRRGRFSRPVEAAFYSTAGGTVKALSLADGAQLWERTLPGKVYSTPAVSGRTLVIGCSDGKVYALDAADGSELWSYACGKSVVASPVIRDGLVYVGASDGCFRALGLSDGRCEWTFSGVEGFVVDRPWVDDAQVVFGTWGRKLYSLDPQTGALQWTWQTSSGSRMISPAACWPVKSHGRIFVAVPDRKVYVIDAKTGSQLDVYGGGREAIGLSEDGETVFAKTMFSTAYAIPASGGGKVWEATDHTGYEIAPTALTEIGGTLLIPTDKGNLIALDAADGSLRWIHKLSIGLVNPLAAWRVGDKVRVLVSTMDGVVSLLEY